MPTHSTLPPLPPGRVCIATGTGRCGTRFLARLLELEPTVASWHERHALADSFHRYCVWNRLDVDDAGFLAGKAEGFREDLAAHAVSFESSAYLALSIPQLREAFEVGVILLLRRPDRVVNSFAAKGWWERGLVRADPERAAGYQPGTKLPHHPFARLVPRGADGVRWNGYTRVGKLACFWRILNERALQAVEALPETARRIVKLEELSFPRYRSLAEFIGFEPTLAADRFDALAATRPNALRPPRSVHDWSDREVHEFETEVRTLAERLGYEWRVEKLRAETPPATEAAHAGRDPDTPQAGLPGPLVRLGARICGVLGGRPR